MAAYHALSAMANNPNPGSSSLSIRGAATAPSRVVANALRGAGISARTQGMDVDGGGVARGGDRPRGGVERRKRASGPLDQVGFVWFLLTDDSGDARGRQRSPASFHLAAPFSV